jgi:hypothetical protein
MLFSSIAFVIFFLSLVLVAFALVQRVSYRLSLVLLLAASLFFYDFFYDGYHVPAYIALLLGSIAWNFAFGRGTSGHSLRSRFWGSRWPAQALSHHEPPLSQACKPVSWHLCHTLRD